MLTAGTLKGAWFRHRISGLAGVVLFLAIP